MRGFRWCFDDEEAAVSRFGRRVVAQIVFQPDERGGFVVKRTVELGFEGGVEDRLE